MTYASAGLLGGDSGYNYPSPAASISQSYSLPSQSYLPPAPAVSYQPVQYSAPAPAPIYSAPAPAPIYSAPAPAPHPVIVKVSCASIARKRRFFPP